MNEADTRAEHIDPALAADAVSFLPSLYYRGIPHVIRPLPHSIIYPNT